MCTISKLVDLIDGSCKNTKGYNSNMILNIIQLHLTEQRVLAYTAHACRVTNELLVAHALAFLTDQS